MKDIHQIAVEAVKKLEGLEVKWLFHSDPKTAQYIIESAIEKAMLGWGLPIEASAARASGEQIMNKHEIAAELFTKLDECIETHYPDYGYEWDKEEALEHIEAAIEKGIQTFLCDGSAARATERERDSMFAARLAKEAGDAVTQGQEWTPEWLNKQIENMLPPEALRNVCGWHTAAIDKAWQDGYGKGWAACARESAPRATESK